MKGYTIQHSIELLEKEIDKSGSGGASTAAQVSFDNTRSGLVATNVQGAIDELKSDIPTVSDYGVNVSTDEKVVGTYLGDVLYEKSFSVTTPAAGTATVVIELDAGCVIKAFDGLVNNSRPIDATYDANNYIRTWISTSNAANLAMLTDGADFVSKPAVITVQYTKTTPVTNTRNKKSKKEEIK